MLRSPRLMLACLLLIPLLLGSFAFAAAGCDPSTPVVYLTARATCLIYPSIEMLIDGAVVSKPGPGGPSCSWVAIIRTGVHTIEFVATFPPSTEVRTSMRANVVSEGRWSQRIDVPESAAQYIPELAENGNAVEIEVETISEPPEVSFPDPGLEAAIREAIGKPSGPIGIPDLQNLSSLNANARGIANLTGIEYCMNLTYLNLRENMISDISPLSCLTKLNYLYIDRNRISDISAVSGLTNLLAFGVTWNQVSDISALAGLINARTLHLHHNQIVDISVLSGLASRLLYVDLRTNLISDISPLSALVNLGTLHLHENQITDISPLFGLTNLTALYLDYNNIADMSGLSGLINLTSLSLQGTQMSDISPLVGNAGLGQGDYLDIRGNNFDLHEGSQDVADIRTLENRGVEVIHDPILPGANEIVNFPDTNLESAIRAALNKPQGPIYKPELQNLTALAAGWRGIRDLTGLEHCINLTSLDLGHNQLVGISLLSGLTRLSWINLQVNQIGDMSPLLGNGGIGQGDYLDIRSNNLDLQEGSQDVADIVALKNRGVEVIHDPIMIVSPNPLADAVDNGSLAWATGGSADWFLQTSTSYYGGDAAQSGAISGSQTTWLKTTVAGPGTLKFYWKVSSQNGYDKLWLLIDNVRRAYISGDVDWQQKTFSILPGTHTLEWRYEKNFSTDEGSDCGWVDRIEFAR